MSRKRGKHPFVAIDHIKDFNNLKLVMKNTSFTKELFRNELKKIDLPCNEVFWSSLVKFKLIKRTSRTGFTFVDSKPVHFKLLENVYLDYSERLLGYVQNYRSNKTKKELEARQTEAINFLKKLGYQIYAPVGDLYAKL